jgi:hypothetical protein
MKSRNSNFIKTSRFVQNCIIPNQNLEVLSTVSFSTLHVQTVNGVDITAEAKKQDYKTSRDDVLEARIFILDKILNVLLTV